MTCLTYPSLIPQRTATFLSPRDPRYSLAVSREPRVSGGAIDIRFYKLSLEKLPLSSK